MAHPDFEVVGVVGGCDFDRAGAEFRVHVLVGDNGQLPVDEWVRQAGADQVTVALVIGMDGDRGIAQHRLDPGGGDHDVGLRVVKRAVPKRHQLAFDVAVVDLEVGDRGLQHRRPVDQPLGPIDQPGVIKPLEDRAHRPRQTFVHGEPVAAPVHPVTESAHLAADGTARLSLPIPHLVHEQLAAEVFFSLAVDRQLLLDHALGGDPGMVGARLPEHLIALHPLAPRQGVHHGVFQRVAHVQAAGHVRRRQHDRIGRLGAGRVRGEVASVQPLLIDGALHRGRIPRLGQHIGGRVRAGGHRSILGTASHRHESARNRPDSASQSRGLQRHTGGRQTLQQGVTHCGRGG
ncbi:Uncharacterised protein [Mycobacterium tuberculosis]|nr:Uncharacterised protein [Mycobacterium tuberculosis]CNV35470.1 Uncharacterised protein [Mycobacterium tuberculosis]CNV38220.1 Uncharacterised protein [Mycobacterium tuberculosis]